MTARGKDDMRHVTFKFRRERLSARQATLGQLGETDFYPFFRRFYRLFFD